MNAVYFCVWLLLSICMAGSFLAVTSDTHGYQTMNDKVAKFIVFIILIPSWPVFMVYRVCCKIWSWLDS